MLKPSSTMAENMSAGMDAITKLKSTEPPHFLSPNPDLSLTTRLASQHLFESLKPHCPKSPFDHLLIDGFDAEQIWQQIDIQSQPLISQLKREIIRYERDPHQILNLFKRKERNGVVGRGVEENGNVCLERDSDDFEMEEDEKDDDDSEGDEDEDDDEDEEEDDDDEEFDDADGVPEVEDDFLKIKELERYLEREEKKEFGGEEIKKKKKKKGVNVDKGSKKGVNDDDDDEGESEEDIENDVDELLMYGGEDDDEDGAEDNIRFEDFFVANKKMPKKRGKQMNESDDSEMEVEKYKPKRKEKHVDESDEQDESEESEEEDAHETEDIENKSTYEREREKLQAKIEQMEEANLAAKDWTMQGEVTASKRPRDSALEFDLEFEHNVRPPPVITEDVTESLEDIIKKRISEENFDDVQKAPKLPSSAPKERKELDDNKSKKGLAEIYEEEYAKQTGLASAPLSHNDELRKEATDVFKRLCLKLDALSHFHFAPKPVVEDMSIQSNVPALAMEEIAPVAVSDAAMLAPEEVFAGKGDIKEDAELTKEDRKKRRAKKKRKFKAINASKVISKAEKTLQNPSAGTEA